MTEAMRLVRAALGEDAIIVASRDEGAGVRVTAAVDDAVLTPALEKKILIEPADDASPTIDLIAQAMVDHNAPSVLAEKIVATATQHAQTDPILSIGAALDTHFSYAPLYDEKALSPIIFIGPAGAGKTLCAAKMATLLTIAQRPPAVLSTDTQRAGGMAQLAAFTRVLDIGLIEIEDPHALADALAMQKSGTLSVIDTAGCNPFLESDRLALGALVKATGASPVLVLPADMDAREATDMARAFKTLGANRLLPTRLDTTRRLGAMLCVAHETRLPFCAFSASPKATDAPQALNPASLAHLLLPKTRLGAWEKDSGAESPRRAQP